MNLLDSKRSLNVNIFLRQFRVSPSELVTYLRNAVPGSDTVDSTAGTVTGDSLPGSGLIELSLEQLRGLQRVLPESDDVEALKSFVGDVARLGAAEKFYFELIQLPQ